MKFLNMIYKPCNKKFTKISYLPVLSFLPLHLLMHRRKRKKKKREKKSDKCGEFDLHFKNYRSFEKSLLKKNVFKR